jgi:protein-S-isoprenylcysteine O-methyltransferase
MYLTVFGISLGAWLLFEIWVFLRDRGKEKGEAAVGARRSIAALAIAIALAMNIPGIAPMFDVQRNFAIYFWAGILLVWAGMLFRFWAVRVLGMFFSTRLVIQQGHELITAGPYRWIRNPSYTGGLITLIGLGISLGNGLSFATLLLTGLLVYVWRIRAEEKMLVQAFGARYEEYKKKTWALIPFVW